jgi:hypothetical protein
MEEVRQLEHLVTIEAIHTELTTLQGDYTKDLNKVLETMFKTFKTLAAKRNRWHELRSQFRGEFSALSNARWARFSLDAEDVEQKQRFQKGLEQLRENGLKPGLLLTMPDDSQGKYDFETLATFEMTQEVRKVAVAAPGVYPDNRTSLTLGELIDIAGWIPDYVYERL